MSLPSQLPATGKAVIEIKESLIESVPLPFASVALSDNYHLALLRNLGVDGGLAVFSNSADSFYVSSTVSLPPITPAAERDISSFCKLVDKGLVKANNSVIRIQTVCAHLPALCTFFNKAGYQYLRVYRINDFLAASGYWLLSLIHISEPTRPY